LAGTLTKPEAVIEYSQGGSSWTDIANKLINYDIWLRDLAAGMSQATFIFDDKGNSLMKDVFPFQPVEKGLYWHLRAKVNEKYLLNGRIFKIHPSIGMKDTITVEARCYGQELLRKFIGKNYTEDPKKADDLIEDILEVCKVNDVEYTSPHTASLPLLSPDYTDKCPYIHDVIREVAEQVDYAAFVKTQAAVTKGTLQFFPKDDPNKRHTTILKSILFSSGSNIREADMPRSIDEMFNWIALVGRLSECEPPDGDSWTEDPNMKGWYSCDGGITHVTWFGDNPRRGNYAIGGVTYAKKGVHFKLSIPDVLNDVFDCVARKGTSLNFDFMVSHGMELPYTLTKVEPILILEDANGNRLQHNLFNPLLYDIPSQTWRPEGIPIGSDDYIYYSGYPGGKPRGTAYWLFYDGGTGRPGRPTHDVFYWDKIRFIEFEDICDTRVTSMNTWLRIDALWFGQSYQASYIAKDDASISKYGLAMQKPMKTEYASFQSLKAYGDELIKGTCRPTLLFNMPEVVLNPGGESLYPSYSIKVDTPRLSVNPEQPWFRILEIHYKWSPFQVAFQLIPSTVTAAA